MTPKQPTVGGKVKQHSLGSIYTTCPPSTQQTIYILKQLSFYLPAHNTNNDIFRLDMLFYLFIYFNPNCVVKL